LQLAVDSFKKNEMDEGLLFFLETEHETFDDCLPFHWHNILYFCFLLRFDKFPENLSASFFVFFGFLYSENTITSSSLILAAVIIPNNKNEAGIVTSFADTVEPTVTTTSRKRPVFQNTKSVQVKSLYMEPLLSDHLS